MFNPSDVTPEFIADVGVKTGEKIDYALLKDGDVPNRMDDEPFLVFDLLDIDRTLLPELEKLSRESFDLDSIVNAADELKYVGLVRRALAEEVKEPSDDWVAYFASKVYEGRRTKAVIDQFRPVVKKSVSQYISEQVNDRLKSALGEYPEEPAVTVPVPTAVSSPEPADVGARVDTVASDIVTTEE